MRPTFTRESVFVMRGLTAEGPGDGGHGSARRSWRRIVKVPEGQEAHFWEQAAAKIDGASRSRE